MHPNLKSESFAAVALGMMLVHILAALQLLADLASDRDVRKKAALLARDYRDMLEDAQGRMNFGPP